MFRKGLLLFFIAFGSCFSQNLIFDHNSISDFENLSENEINSAKNIRIMFRHASVGTTIDNALNCLQGTRSNPKQCTEYEPYKYDRRNWAFQGRPNSGWIGKIDDFKTEVENNINNFDVFSFKFCFLDGLDQSFVPCGKPFDESKTNESWQYLKNAYEELEAKYPDKIFVWWTIPLTQSGQFCTDYLNNKIREYCRLNNKILYDIADIECHDTLGNKVTNDEDWEIAFKPYCGEQKEGAEACHPNWNCSIMMAKIFWVMVDKIAKLTSVDIKDTFIHNNSILFPNPATTEINISLSDIKSIEIFNVLGLKLLSQTNVEANRYLQIRTIDISKLKSGIYFIKIETNNNYIIKKIVKR